MDDLKTDFAEYELIYLDDFRKTKWGPYRKRCFFMPVSQKEIINLNKLIKNFCITSKKGISLEQTIHITESVNSDKSDNMRNTYYVGGHQGIIDLDDKTITELIGINGTAPHSCNSGIALPRLTIINSLFYVCELNERMFSGNYKMRLHILFSKKGILDPIYNDKLAIKYSFNKWEQDITAFDIQLGGILPKEYVVPKTH